MKEKLVTLREASDFLGFTEQEIVNLAEEEKIPHFHVGGEFIRFRKEDLLQIKDTLYKDLKIRPKNYSFTDKMNDFFYFNDFYIFSAAIILVLCVVIFAP